MWQLFLVFLTPAHQLHLKSGEVVPYDHIQRGAEVVLLQRGASIFSLPVAAVQWRQEADGASNPPGWQRVRAPERLEDRFAGEDFIIARLDVRQTSLIDLLRFLSDTVGFNLFIDSSVEDRKVTFSLHHISWKQALAIVLENAGLDAEMQSSLVSVRPL